MEYGYVHQVAFGIGQYEVEAHSHILGSLLAIDKRGRWNVRAVD